MQHVGLWSDALCPASVWDLAAFRRYEAALLKSQGVLALVEKMRKVWEFSGVFIGAQNDSDAVILEFWAVALEVHTVLKGLTTAGPQHSGTLKGLTTGGRSGTLKGLTTGGRSGTLKGLTTGGRSGTLKGLTTGGRSGTLRRWWG